MRKPLAHPGIVVPGIALALGLCLALWHAIALYATGLQATLPGRPERVISVSTAAKTFIPYSDARPVVERLRQNLPAELMGKSPAELEAAWSGWVLRRDTAIRSRLERGDEDSVVHFWHYGTSFTTLPPVTERNVARLGGADAARVVDQRLDDLVSGMVSPGIDERLQFARRVLERRGIDPVTPAGSAKAREYLEAVRRRVLAEYEEHRRILDSAQLLDPVTALAAYVTMFRDRGLSSDTSLLPSFAIEQALETIKSQGLLGAGSVRRVAIVGPGLDFANKDDGYDFYPQQTIQPFAIMDSLVRLGLARQDELIVATFDLSPRVNQHLEASLTRARAGDDYLVHLPLQGEERWNPDFLAYWKRFGDRIGAEAEARAVPSMAGVIRIRAVRIRSAAVASIVPRDLNIVLERLEPLAANERFDLIVATNMLVYYDVFEQELALANIAAMLRQRGLFLSNTPVPPMPPMKMSDRYSTVSYSERHRDHLFWYERE
ncbi:MAG: hypothetical protein ACRD3C_20380 [Vicinamibacterales bacterium]